jgi:hypothetical protein
MLPGPGGRTSPPRSPHIFSSKRRQPAGEVTDQSLAPSFLADEGRRTLAGTSDSTLPLWRLPPLQSRCCERCARPPARTWPANMHARGRRHRDRRTASIPAMAAAAAKNIAKRSASYAHANPRLNKETSAIIVSSRTLASNPRPPLFREHTLALSRMSISRRQISDR